MSHKIYWRQTRRLLRRIFTSSYRRDSNTCSRELVLTWNCAGNYRNRQVTLIVAIVNWKLVILNYHGLTWPVNAFTVLCSNISISLSDSMTLLFMYFMFNPAALNVLCINTVNSWKYTFKCGFILHVWRTIFIMTTVKTKRTDWVRLVAGNVSGLCTNTRCATLLLVTGELFHC